MAVIQFHTADLGITLPGKTILKTLLSDLFRKEGKQLAGLSIVFCSDEYLLELNRQFLQHDYYTDILTFLMSERGAPVEGELYISIDRVRDNARALGVPAMHELRRVILHGALHLCGYKDKLKKDQALIRQKEDRYLQLLKKRMTHA
ncbi:MAG: rRNA maturation RNase YbeY [Chitinophagia bacterium]